MLEIQNRKKKRVQTFKIDRTGQKYGTVNNRENRVQPNRWPDQPEPNRGDLSQAKARTGYALEPDRAALRRAGPAEPNRTG